MQMLVGLSDCSVANSVSFLLTQDKLLVIDKQSCER